MNLIDYRDARPIYEQIEEKYKMLILKGVLLPDEQMPSVRSLAMELSANPNTVQKAYTELERDGFLYSVKGKGNFVCHSDGLKNERRSLLKKKIVDILFQAEEIGISSEELMKEAMENVRKGEKND